MICTVYPCYQLPDLTQTQLSSARTCMFCISKSFPVSPADQMHPMLCSLFWQYWAVLGSQSAWDGMQLLDNTISGAQVDFFLHMSQQQQEQDQEGIQGVPPKKGV